MRLSPRSGGLLLLAMLCLPLAALPALAGDGSSSNSPDPTEATAIVIVPRGHQCTMLAPDVDFKTVDLEGGLGVRITAKDPNDVDLIRKSVKLLMMQDELSRLEEQRMARLRSDWSHRQGPALGSFNKRDINQDGRISRQEYGQDEGWSALQKQHDRNHDNNLDRSEWRQAQQSRDQQLGNRNTSRALQGKTFSGLDRNGNGKISQDEVGSGATWQRLVQYDDDDSGTISRTEWQEVRADSRNPSAMSGNGRWQGLLEYDQNGDGQLSESEWDAIDRSERRSGYGRDTAYADTEYTFDEVDKNHDGQVSESELRRADARQELYAQAEENVRSAKEQKRYEQSQGTESGRRSMPMGSSSHEMAGGFCASQISPMLGLMAENDVQLSSEKIDDGMLLKFTSDDQSTVKKLKLLGKLHETWSELESTSTDEGSSRMHGGLSSVLADVMQHTDISVERTDDGVDIQLKAENAPTQKKLNLLAKMAKLSHDLQRVDEQAREASPQGSSSDATTSKESGTNPNSETSSNGYGGSSK